MPQHGKARQTAAFGLEGIYRITLEITPSRVGDVVLAAAQRTLHPGIDQIENERRVYANRRMQARRRLPGAIAHATDEFADRAGLLQRYGMTVAGQHVTVTGHAGRFDLQPFDR